jgi:hypothetical protein
MNSALRARIRLRAGDRCEYCQLHQRETVLPHEVDHIRARKHLGRNVAANLCLACAYCNSSKGPNVAGHDPLTDELVALYNPRSQSWSEHFVWRGPVLEGKTSSGRATIAVLRIDDREGVEHRRLLTK